MQNTFPLLLLKTLFTPENTPFNDFYNVLAFKLFLILLKVLKLLWHPLLISIQVQLASDMGLYVLIYPILLLSTFFSAPNDSLSITWVPNVGVITPTGVNQNQLFHVGNKESNYYDRKIKKNTEPCCKWAVREGAIPGHPLRVPCSLVAVIKQNILF